MTNEISYETLQFGTERIEVTFRKALPLDTQNRGIELQTHSKIEFKPGISTLKKGATFFENGVALPYDITWQRDVGVKMRDGVTIYADIFLPVDADNLPAILSWSPYGKTLPQPAPPGVAPSAVSGLQKFEGPDPAYWCNHGYAVINVDARGSFFSEGDIYMWGTTSANDCNDFIQWTAAQSWCNGKVAMSGNSWLGIIQWFTAAHNPPHLAAIAPWEGHIDLYRCDVLRGGIRDTAFNNFNTSTQIGMNRIEDMTAMAEKYPLMNAYWKDKAPQLEKITVPAYIVASWGGHHTIDAFRRISSREKWLRVHNTGEWPDCPPDRGDVHVRYPARTSLDDRTAGFCRGDRGTVLAFCCIYAPGSHAHLAFFHPNTVESARGPVASYGSPWRFGSMGGGFHPLRRLFDVWFWCIRLSLAAARLPPCPYGLRYPRGRIR